MEQNDKTQGTFRFPGDSCFFATNLGLDCRVHLRREREKVYKQKNRMPSSVVGAAGVDTYHISRDANGKGVYPSLIM